jgi:hypothetical protein
VDNVHKHNNFVKKEDGNEFKNKWMKAVGAHTWIAFVYGFVYIAVESSD